jgi:hypothetical protein
VLLWEINGTDFKIFYGEFRELLKLLRIHGCELKEVS